MCVSLALSRPQSAVMCLCGSCALRVRTASQPKVRSWCKITHTTDSHPPTMWGPEPLILKKNFFPKFEEKERHHHQTLQRHTSVVYCLYRTPSPRANQRTPTTKGKQRGLVARQRPKKGSHLLTYYESNAKVLLQRTCATDCFPRRHRHGPVQVPIAYSLVTPPPTTTTY